MNKQRRNVLHGVLDDLARLRDPVEKTEAVEILTRSQNLIEQCCDEEEAALDRRPENLQWSTTNDNMTDNISDLSEVAGDLEILVDECQKIDVFDYELIKNDIIKIVNTLKQVIHR